ncbi:hypothetical protein JCM5353_000335 [Sporobolomyces roseus]
MSGLLRYTSYSSSHSASHHIRPSPSSAALTPPTDPFPPQLNSLKPSDILINRSHQLKRFAKHLSLYFQGLAQAHHQHSLTLQKLPANIPLPIQESTIFLPPSTNPDQLLPDGGEPVTPLGGTGNEGWAQILHEIKSTNQRVVNNHQELAKKVNKDVVGPLNKLRESMKGHINAMEKDINRLCDAVQRERDLTAPLLSRLASALTTQPLRPQFSDDPLVIRAQLEHQLSNQLQKENELLSAVKAWTDKTEGKEKELFSELAKCWRDWESTNSAMLLGTQQLSMFLSATVDSVPPELEWNHFLKLNHTIPSDLPPKTLSDLEWEGKGDERCGIIKEGLLERQTSWIKSWKSAYFILTPTGHLLLYPPPSSATPTRSRASTTSTGSIPAPPPTHHSRSTPSTPDLTSNYPSSPIDNTSNPPSTSLSSISPTAFHLLTTSTPLLSLHLPSCSLGPMPTPEHESPLPTSTSPEGATQTPPPTLTPTKKSKSLDAAFTLTESEGKGTKHILRASVAHSSGGGGGEDGGDQWEEMGKWVKEISQFTLPQPPSPNLMPTPTLLPPALPSRSISTTSSSSSINSPPLPQLPSSSTSSEEPTPTPTPASTSIFGTFFGGSSTRSSTTSATSTSNKSISTSSPSEEEEIDLSSSSIPPPLPPRDQAYQRSSLSLSSSQPSILERQRGESQDAVLIEDQPISSSSSSEETVDHEGEEEDLGDLGRSLSPKPLTTRAPPPPLPSRSLSNGGGRVANLAKAFDQDAFLIRERERSGSVGSNGNGSSIKSPVLGAGGDGIEEVFEEENGNTGGGGGKKGKKGGRKSKEKKQLVLPPSVPPLDQEEEGDGDLSLASPPLDLGNTSSSYSTGENPFDLSLSHLQLHNDEEGQAGDMSLDDQEKGEEEEEVRSPPPMVLEEVEEGPETSSGDLAEEKEKEGDGEEKKE